MNIFTQLALTIDADKVGVPKITDVDGLLQNGLNLTYFIAGVIAVIVIIIGGIMYATSGGVVAKSGEAGKVQKAKNLILFAVIGLVIIFMAFAITNFVIGRF